MINEELRDDLMRQWRAKGEVKIIDFDEPATGSMYLPHYLYLLEPIKDHDDDDISVLIPENSSYKFIPTCATKDGKEVKIAGKEIDRLDVMKRSSLVIVDGPYDLIIAIATNTPFYIITENPITINIAKNIGRGYIRTKCTTIDRWERALHNLKSKGWSRARNFGNMYRNFLRSKDRWDFPWEVLYDKALGDAMRSPNLSFLTLTYIYVDREELNNLVTSLTHLPKCINRNIKIKVI